MNRIKTTCFSLLLLLFCLFVQQAKAQYSQEEKRKVYDWTEKWYYQVQGGVNYLAAENTRFVNVSKILQPSWTFSVGKWFSPFWASGIRFIYGKDKGVYFSTSDSPLFSFDHYGIVLDGEFNISNYLSGNRYVGSDRKWNVELKLGMGYFHSGCYKLDNSVTNYTVLNPIPRDILDFYGGVEFSRSIGNDFDVNFELNMHRLGNKYNGQTAGESNEVIGDLSLTALIGIRYTIPIHKPCPKEIVYVNQPIDQPKASDTIAVTPMPKEPDCYEIDELLQMVKEGKNIRGKRICDIEMVHFDFDKSDILPVFALYLDKLSTLMLNTDIRLLIMGHTDIKGSVEYNYDLSERRSKAVMKYLHDKGIDYGRMVFSYDSKLKPRTENISDYGRSVNRRVEFRILP